MGTQQFCLKWNNHSSNMLEVFGQMLSNEALVDVTLACADASLKAHRLVLSACSSFFQKLFLENPCPHPIIILHDLNYTDLRALLEFMYNGEVNVSQDQLTTLLKVAETLKVKGLGDFLNEQKQKNFIKKDKSLVNQQSSDPTLPAEKSTLIQSEKSCNPTEQEEINNETYTDSSSNFLSRYSNSSPCEKKDEINLPNKQHDPTNQQSYTKNDNMSIVITNVESAVESVSCEEEQFDLEPCCLMEQSMTTEKEKEIMPQQTGHTTDVEASSSDLDSDKDENFMSKKGQDSNSFPHQDMQIIKMNCNDWDDNFTVSPSTSFSQSTNASAMNTQASSSSSPQVVRVLPTFATDNMLKVGMLSITELEDPSHVPKRGRKPGSRLCVLCKHIFNCESDLEKHMQNHRDGTISNVIEPSTVPVTLATPDPQSVTEDNLVMFPQPCSVCNYVLNTMSDAQSHLTMNPVCRTSQFKCPLCPKIFIWPATLTKHFREQHLGPEGTARVTQRLWFFCDICKKPLLSKHALSLHKSKFHGSHPSSHVFDHKSDNINSCKRGRKQGTRVCRQCKRTFTSTNDFHLHLQNSHKDEPPFQWTQELSLATTGDESSFSGMSSAENESNSAQSSIKGD